MELAAFLKWYEIIKVIAGVIANCMKKLKEVRDPNFNPDTIDLQQLRSELVNLPDLEPKP